MVLARHERSKQLLLYGVEARPIENEFLGKGDVDQKYRIRSKALCLQIGIGFVPHVQHEALDVLLDIRIGRAKERSPLCD